MKFVLVSFLLFLFHINGGYSQDISCSGNVKTVASDNFGIALDPTEPERLCIRCGVIVGTMVELYTDIDEVTYTGDLGGTLANDTSAGITITNDGLIIDDPVGTFDNGDTLQCTFTPTGMSPVTYQITITYPVLFPPYIVPAGSVVNVVEGDSVTLTCNRNVSSSDGDRYQWRLPDGSVSPEGLPIAEPDGGLPLELSSIERSASGIYSCNGDRTSVVLNVQSNITVNVLYPGRILSLSPGNTTVTVGSVVTFNCSFEGNPVPVVSWSHNRSEAFPLEDPNLSETLTDSYSLLEVNLTNINISGEYGCGANNSIGSDVTDFTIITVQVAPGPVINLNASSTDKCVTLYWSFGFNGNAPITGTTITYSATNNHAEGSHTGTTSTSGEGVTTATICQLEPYTTYQFNITVSNEVSNTVGVSSVEVTSIDTLPVVPDRPTLDSVVAISSTELRVTWTPNINSSTQSPIDGFEIQYNVVDGQSLTNITRVNDPLATTQVLDNLSKGTEYRVVVLSGNSAGPSPPSDPMVQRTDIDPPSAVRNLRISPKPFLLCIEWDVPEDNGGQDIEEYSVNVTLTNFTFVNSVGANVPVLTFTQENLLNNTEYNVSVAASNEGNGEGGLGEISTLAATTGGVLVVDPMFIVNVTYVTAVSVTVQWTVPEDNNNDEYRIQITEEDYFDPEVFTSHSAMNRSAVVDGLNPNTSYIIRMTRIEEGGCTRRVSETSDFETLDLEVEVDAPRNVTAGDEVVLECRLSTGELAPDVEWNRISGGSIPDSADIDGAQLTIRNPVEGDSGEYSCSSRVGTPDEATFTFSLLVLPRPSTTTTVPTETSPPPVSPTVEEVSGDLALWIIIVIAVGAFICVIIFVVVLIIFIYFCCFRGNSEKKTARYDLAKETTKKQSGGSGGMWLDEGASGFSSIPQYNPDASEPAGRGRTMTNDYVSATSFNNNTYDKKGSMEKLTETAHDHSSPAHSTDV